MRVADLAPEIVASICAGASIGQDLERLERVAGVDAPEAAVFYAGRILDLLIAEEVRLVGGEPSANVYGNLVALSELGILPELSARLAHALRRVANEARHVWRPLTSADAELAQALLVHVLRWHFTRFARGPLLTNVWSVPPHEADPLTRFVETLDLGSAGMTVQRMWQADGRLACSPFATALYVETLIAEGTAEAGGAAETCMEDALARHPNDLRLRQLDGWLARLRGDLAKSAKKLESLLEEGEDVETVGLLAGTYKRMGELSRAAELYRSAWKRSDRRSTYAGINAASMTLIAGQRDAALKIASQVLALFERRRGANGAASFTGYWDIVTYAEALLLAGKRDEAVSCYREAFTRHAEQRGWIESTRFQLAQLLTAIDGDSSTIDTFISTGSSEP